MAFQATGPTETSKDEGYGENYGAERTETTYYKHPNALIFMHVHRDGKDREDSYVCETVTIGDLEIKYFKDLGNWFAREDITIKRNGTEISYVERSQGAVDRLKFDTRNREDGQKVFAEIGIHFGMDSRQLAKAFASVFKINVACLAKNKTRRTE